MSASQWSYAMHIDDLAKSLNLKRSFIEKYFEFESSDGALSIVTPQSLKNYLSDKGVSFGPKVISFINMRGGIGKTTGTVSVGTRLSQYGFKTAILDLDSQASATLAMNRIPEEDDPVFYDIWQNPQRMVPGSLRSISNQLSILPSSLENGLLDASMVSPISQKNGVRNVTEVMKSMGYERIVIDAPPSIGAAVISAICASDEIIIPVGSDPFSIKGLEMTIEEIESICDTFQISLPKINILYSRYDRREKISETTLEFLRNEYSERLLDVVIRTSTEFSKAFTDQQTVFAKRKKSTARTDYDQLTKELLHIKN